MLGGVSRARGAVTRWRSSGAVSGAVSEGVRSFASKGSSGVSERVSEGVRMDTLVALCKRRGFVYPSAEVYSSAGASGFFDFGPLGVELKNNLKQLWWARMVRGRQDVVGVDSAIVGPAVLFQASGHADEFSDMMVDCRETKLRYRADQVHWAKVEAISGNGSDGTTSCVGYICFVEEEGRSLTESAEARARQLAKKKKVSSLTLRLPLQILDLTQADCEEDLPFIPGPDSGVAGSLTNPRTFNLMFDTSVGPVAMEEGNMSNKAYLRPETAQGIFTNFFNVQRTSRMKIPFGIAQIGKAFRNEITPRNFIFRSREFEMMELEYFIPPEKYYSDKYFKELLEESWSFLLEVGVDEALMTRKVHEKGQLAHYANCSTDIEFQYPFGVQELMGVADRGSFDLDCHARGSGKSFEYLDKENFSHLQCDTSTTCDDVAAPTQRKYVPHCIEPSIGVDRLFLALLTSAYTEEELGDGDKRTVLKLKRRVAPVKASVLPLVKNNPDIMDKAQEIHRIIRKRYNCEFDSSGAVGRRYRRADEIGVPLCITVDFESLEDGCVTVRDRDSMQQRRVPISDLETIMYQEIELSDD